MVENTIEGKFAVRVRYKNGYTNLLIGQCIDMPFIIVEAKTLEGLLKEIAHELVVYFSTFPKERDRLLKQLEEQQATHEAGGTKAEPVAQHEEGWTEIKVPIPRRR